MKYTKAPTPEDKIIDLKPKLAKLVLRASNSDEQLKFLECPGIVIRNRKTIVLVAQVIPQGKAPR